MINRAKAAICAVVILLMAFASAGCGAGAKDAIGALRDNLPELKSELAENVRELAPDTSQEVIDAACANAGIATPSPTPINVGSAALTKLENELEAEDNLSNEGQDAAYLFCKAHDALNS